MRDGRKSVLGLARGNLMAHVTGLKVGVVRTRFNDGQEPISLLAT